MLARLLPLFILCAAGANARAEALFDAKSTYAVVSGVLEWKESGLSAFPKEKRKDQQLFDELARLGVPAAQTTLLLDEAATAKAIERALERAVQRAPAGSTLVFYYAGHGVKDNDGNIIFASADIELGNLEATGLHLSVLSDLLRGFKGKRLILLADCCYSGGLVAVAGALAGKVQVLALTSAEASNISTKNWTYTQTLLDALSGRPLLDRNDNGTLTLAELHAEVAENMRFREGQRSGWASHGLADDLEVARAGAEPERLAQGSGDFERRDWVLASPGGSSGRRMARILGAGGADERPAKKAPRIFVEFYDYATATREWVEQRATIPVSFQTWPAGTLLDVTWAREVYGARVLKVEDGFMWITYPGWGTRWDEWITAARVVGLTSLRLAKKKAQVEWRGRWFDAVVNSQEGDKWCISYVGFASDWDECVEKKRIRFD